MACLAAVPALAVYRGEGRTQAQNHRSAIQDARKLLTRVELPADATRSEGNPAGAGGGLSGPPSSQAGVKQVDLASWWTAGESRSAVLKYVQAHPPAGGRLTMSGGEGRCRPGQRPPHCPIHLTWVGFSFPAVRGVLGTRWLLVQAERLKNGSTGIRADAEVQWIIPRPSSETVPSGVTAIEVVRRVNRRPPTVSRTVTRRGQVQRIIKLIDRLPALQPGVWSCPAAPGDPAIVTLTFETRPGGAPAAQAHAPADSGNSETGCDAMSFSVRGRRQTPLVHTRHFLTAVGRLLGVRLTERFGR